MKRLTGGDRAALLVHLDANGPAFDELARRLDLPRPGCRAALDEFARAERADHPLVAMIVENARGVRHVVNRMQAFRAMLRGARPGAPWRARLPCGRGPIRRRPVRSRTPRQGLPHPLGVDRRGSPEVALTIGDPA